MVIGKRKLKRKNNGTEIYLLKRNVETSCNQSKKKKKKKKRKRKGVKEEKKTLQK
jgi:hypothetical protein